jgi:hypothetical protein
VGEYIERAGRTCGENCFSVFFGASNKIRKDVCVALVDFNMASEHGKSQRAKDPEKILRMDTGPFYTYR